MTDNGLFEEEKGEKTPGRQEKRIEMSLNSKYYFHCKKFKQLFNIKYYGINH